MAPLVCGKAWLLRAGPLSLLRLTREGFKGGRDHITIIGSSLVAEPTQGIEKLPYKSEGYNFWTWRGHKIHYVVGGEGFPIVLIHGFGASVFHWRYNIPELAKTFKVYALDLLDFASRDKRLTPTQMDEEKAE